MVSFDELNFQIAFGVINYAANGEVVNDAKHVKWNVYLEERLNLRIVGRTEVSIHPCEERDFIKFYPVSQNSVRMLEFLKETKALYCIDEG